MNFIKKEEKEMDQKNNWNAGQWEEYLKNIESPQTELLLNNPNLVEVMSEEKFREGVASLMGQNYSPKLNQLVALLMETLTDKQKKVIHCLYWKSMTQREVATQMGVSHAAVQNIRDRALAGLGKILLNSRKTTKGMEEEGVA